MSTDNNSNNRIFVFNGDYVDRGAWGLETFLLLLAWKLTYASPDCTEELLKKFKLKVNALYDFEEAIDSDEDLDLASMVPHL
ncbi:hypothetical protein V6N13_112446 [Hibiscus sabdariffa]|uniref:Uncharacterized protein n=1 Tax=Hibiscus sabdariffa TaxID=183260 RepID=A0ABR2TNK1_9ROSI